MGNHDKAGVQTTIEIIETEVLELEKQASDLLAQLHRLLDTIARKRSLAGNLKNSLVPINRLPAEILLACFGKVVQDWEDENDGVDERAVAKLAKSQWFGDADFELPCTPIFAISHVSHHWRHLAINAPNLWTNLVVTPGFEYHMVIFRDVLRRAKGAAKFHYFAPDKPPSPAEHLLLETIMPLVHAQQISALTFLDSGALLSRLFSWVVEQTVMHPQSPPSSALAHLTALSIFGLRYSSGLTFSDLTRLLSAAPQLKTLKLQWQLTLAERPHKTVIALPTLENLTIIESNLFACTFLGSLSAPDVCQLKLLMWDPQPEEDPTASCLFLDDNNDVDSGLRVPRFPKVHNLTLSFVYDYGRMDTSMIGAFPRVTHLTLGNPGLLYWHSACASLGLPAFQCLQHLTLGFAFQDAGDEIRHLNMRHNYYWLWQRKSKNQADRPLLISLLDRSTEPAPDAGKHLFKYYKELQNHGVFDAGSSRLGEFIRWQADGQYPDDICVDSEFLVDDAC